jgi:hypothetical protein
MIPFGKVAGLWNGGGFLRQPDYGFADCQQSVIWASLEAGAPNVGYGWNADMGIRRSRAILELRLLQAAFPCRLLQ